jgi:hypothetical protein
MLANDTTHPLSRPFGLDRFRTGELIDEGASSGMDDKEALL